MKITHLLIVFVVAFLTMANQCDSEKQNIISDEDGFCTLNFVVEYNDIILNIDLVKDAVNDTDRVRTQQLLHNSCLRLFGKYQVDEACIAKQDFDFLNVSGRKLFPYCENPDEINNKTKVPKKIEYAGEDEL